MDTLEVQRVGIGREHRDVQRALPYAQRAHCRNGRANSISRQVGGADAGHRSNQRPEIGTIADLQCLLD